MLVPKYVDEFKQKALKALTKLNLTTSDILKEVEGELEEATYNDISFSYGNGELFASDDFVHLTFVCDDYGYRQTLELVDWISE